MLDGQENIEIGGTFSVEAMVEIHISIGRTDVFLVTARIKTTTKIIWKGHMYSGISVPPQTHSTKLPDEINDLKI